MKAAEFKGRAETLPQNGVSLPKPFHWVVDVLLLLLLLLLLLEVKYIHDPQTCTTKGNSILGSATGEHSMFLGL